MNAVEELEAEARKMLPEARIKLHKPAISPEGWWWLDVHVYGHLAVCIWREESGFAVSIAQADDTPFDRPNPEGADWMRATNPYHALALIMGALLRADGDMSP